MPLLAAAPHRPRTRSLGRLLALALALTTLTALPATAPPSGASSRYLCTGYTACQNAGYSHAGYAQRSRTMFWRMYAGHNCTNYAAYRMIQAGLPAERPWSGSGMAYNWGFAMRHITDTRPRVGSVAWWNRGVSGAGSSGHVAYVERVVSPTEIVISEDSWSGDFHWRTIYKDGTSWPTGFIHFRDLLAPAPEPEPEPAPAPPKPLEVLAPPTVSGTPQVGVALQGGRASMRPGRATQDFQWLVDGVAVPGATGTTYTPTAADVGDPVALRVTGRRQGNADTVTTSEPTAPVEVGAFTRGARPGITGDPQVGQVLTAVPATWTPQPDSSVFRWRADGEWLEDRNGPTLTVTDDLVDATISVVEVPRKRGYRNHWNASGELGPVVAGTLALTAPFAASGEARHGGTLAFTPGTWSPRDAGATYEWFRDGVAVPGATGTTYVLGDGDVGRRITVRSSVTKPSWRGFVRTADYGVVTTPSRVVLRAGGRKAGAIARVRVTAPGVAAPTGTVWARVRRTTVRGTVVDGVAELKLTGLRAGPRTVYVAYGGNGVVDPGRATAQVIVKPKRAR